MGENFKEALKGKEVPLLVLDQKWHRLFAVHGKTAEIKKLEAKENELLARQGKNNSQLKEYKKLKGKLMDGIMQNMDDTSEGGDDALREKKMAENKRLIDELNVKIDACEEYLAELPSLIHSCNEELLLASMEYFYAKIRVNEQEAKEIDEWITQIRIELKKNIIRKQNREINNKEIYSYLHSLLGPEVLDIFDVHLE